MTDSVRIRALTHFNGYSTKYELVSYSGLWSQKSRLNHRIFLKKIWAVKSELKVGGKNLRVCEVAVLKKTFPLKKCECEVRSVVQFEKV